MLDIELLSKNIPFLQAVEQLSGQVAASPPVVRQEKTRVLLLPKANSDTAKVEAYLQSRGIDPEIISQWSSCKQGVVSCVAVRKDCRNNDLNPSVLLLYPDTLCLGDFFIQSRIGLTHDTRCQRSKLHGICFRNTHQTIPLIPRVVSLRSFNPACNAK